MGFTWQQCLLKVTASSPSMATWISCVHVSTTQDATSPIASKSSQNDAGWRGKCDFIARPKHPEGSDVSPFATILDIDAKSGFCVIGFSACLITTSFVQRI